MHEKQHCQDAAHALVLDMCWHITSTEQRQWRNTMQVRLEINAVCVNVYCPECSDATLGCPA